MRFMQGTLLPKIAQGMMGVSLIYTKGKKKAFEVFYNILKGSFNQACQFHLLQQNDTVSPAFLFY